MWTGLAIGTIVSVLPDDDCNMISIDGKTYQECSGTLYEPVYQGNDVQYKVVEPEQKL